AVRSSPWCRCVDTATLAFGGTQVEPALGSPRGGTPEQNRLALDGLRQRIAQMPPEPGRFEVWVTHMFLISDLLGTGTSSGEGWVVRAEAGVLKPLAAWPG
ncbi:MAG: histidine phosphatase family protein, partial [Rubrivivax sp.]